ncbi:hypothetical protein GQ457_05G033560 [Hibiscus cannabinus]
MSVKNSDITELRRLVCWPWIFTARNDLLTVDVHSENDLVSSRKIGEIERFKLNEPGNLNRQNRLNETDITSIC